MATIKQKRALDKIIENHGNVSRAMLEAGYREATAVNPKNLTDSDGFRELCEEYGLTDNLLIKALVSDIKKKPKNRKPELELAFKVRGRLKESDNNGKTQNNIFIFGDAEARRIAGEIVGRGESPLASGE